MSDADISCDCKLNADTFRFLVLPLNETNNMTPLGGLSIALG